MGTNPLQDWARYYAEMGWHIFPVTPNAKKPPMVRDWENRATNDLTRVDRFWSSTPANIGLACGPSGLVGIDLDIPDPNGSHATDPTGLATFAALATARGASIPDTYTVDTPSGGRHLIYAAPEGVHLRNTRRPQIAPYVDSRAEGGYLVAAGSMVPHGSYDLIDDQPPAELPAWMVQACVELPASGAATVTPIRGNPTNSGKAALRGECERVEQAPDNEHNAVLSTAAFRVGLQIGHGNLEHTAARAELLGSGQHMVTAGCDCTAREVERVIDAGLTAGIRNARNQNTETAREIA